jgi:hypothetical protein
MGRDGSGAEEFGAGDSGEDEGGSGEGAGPEAFVEEEQGGEPSEDGFEGEEKRGVDGGKMLLGPALNGEGGGCC